VLNEHLPNNTHEGENTVMYIQTARYIIKSYIGFITKGKPLTDSVKYLEKFNALGDVKFFGKKPWEVEDLRTVLLKAIQHILGVITTRLSQKQEGETQMDIFNYKIGNRLQQLAQLHGVYYTVDAFIEAINREQTPDIKPILADLCKLFSINQIQRLSEAVLEGGFICPVKWTLFNDEKEAIFTRLRPIAVGLVDSFAIPEKFIRSELARGQPYHVSNYLRRTS
jgi:acyl-CoA oxidase